jgi:hypothetical protein
MDRTRQKQVVVSIDNWKTLQTLGHLGMTFDDVITELLNMKQNAIRSEHVLGEANTHPISSTKGKTNG